MTKYCEMCEQATDHIEFYEDPTYPVHPIKQWLCRECIMFVNGKIEPFDMSDEFKEGLNQRMK
jgi:hypothetical protein